MKRRNFLWAVPVLTSALALWPAAAVQAQAAEQYPSKTVRIVVPFAPGGSADKLARTLAGKLGPLWKQTVVVENVTGASGTIAESQVVKASADGHTILLIGDQQALNAGLFKNLSHDTLKDFAPVIKAVVNPQILVVRPGLGIETFQQYVDYLKENPGKFTLALPTNGGIAHIGHEILTQRIGVRPNYIPYPGGGPAILDILGGHIDGTLITLAAVTEHVRAGKLIPLAVSTPYRSKALPDVPTIAESGIEGYAVESWQGFAVPAGTSDDVVARINRDIAQVLALPDVGPQLENLGFSISAGSPQEALDTLRSDVPLFSKIIADAGIKLR